jgi:hypothetical protein
VKTYKVELRHALSKNRLNALRNNRLAPLTAALAEDEAAIDWARDQLVRTSAGKASADWRYVEASVWELPPAGPSTANADSRRLGRWVANGCGLVWRPKV